MIIYTNCTDYEINENPIQKIPFSITHPSHNDVEGFAISINMLIIQKFSHQLNLKVFTSQNM